ncbi:Aste57867_5402 [Aphanomyces stellatus]|uniref:Aste57867_5402 protein n=1 Tax=Aphanomyces stellatus TaxID=120398 RepID=A0A485KFF2_9STRA|nr:hypothetical protein As57867_005389 [Aphanomyces stellatus]VFT82459.1 Aste57867_5402 [Aphanomyces stellatus]
MKKGEVCDTIKKLVHEDMELDPADTIGNCFVGELEMKKPEIGSRQIHVLVVVGGECSKRKILDLSEDSDAQPDQKKGKLIQKDVGYQGPVMTEAFSVPMETIEVYGKLRSLFISDQRARPLCLLYGPRQFGKTTIGHRLWESLARDPSVLVIYHTATKLSVVKEEEFWMALSRCCGEVVSTAHEFMRMISRRKQRLLLVIDEMDVIFKNTALTSTLLDFLREWQTEKYFCGFLGIGSYDLVSLYKYHNGSDQVSPFNLCNAFKVERFSVDQMSNFFKLIEPTYDFTESTRSAIIDYSGGAPGVFGSLIRFSTDNWTWKLERHEWDDWFKIHSFSEYLNKYNWTYSRIRNDLTDMCAATWKALESLLLKGSSIRRSDVGDEADKLLQMGIVIEGTDSTLMFSSEMMRRVCLEALPIRDIKQVENADSPLDLLAASLQFMKPEVISHSLMTNRQCPSESVFQFELYSSIRAIFASNKTTKHVLAEARQLNDRRRLDIIISNGVKYGFELKSNCLTSTEIIAATSQANGYQEALAIDKMFMVNFVPQTHTMDEIYEVVEYPNVQIIHVRFPDSCTEYVMRLQTSGGFDTRSVRCI